MNECFQKGLRLKKIKKVAGAVGFEPTNAGSKSRCLTAWRRPKRFLVLCNFYQEST